jgi:hypothetical protein
MDTALPPGMKGRSAATMRSPSNHQVRVAVSGRDMSGMGPLRDPAALERNRGRSDRLAGNPRCRHAQLQTQIRTRFFDGGEFGINAWPHCHAGAVRASGAHCSSGNRLVKIQPARTSMSSLPPHCRLLRNSSSGLQPFQKVGEQKWPGKGIALPDVAVQSE